MPLCEPVLLPGQFRAATAILKTAGLHSCLVRLRAAKRPADPSSAGVLGDLFKMQMHRPWVAEGALFISRNVARMSVAIAPRLSVRRSARALEFYKSAFGANVVHFVDGGENGVMAQLDVHGAHFWLSEESPEHGNFSPETIGGAPFA